MKPKTKILKLKLDKIKKKILDNVKDAQSADPIAPIIVLFGLIFVNFGPLNNLPKINPPKSEATQQKTNENKTILK